MFCGTTSPIVSGPDLCLGRPASFKRFSRMTYSSWAVSVSRGSGGSGGVAGCVWAITADEPNTISNPVSPPTHRLIVFRGSNLMSAAPA
jgi:hypothetical protein